MYCSRSHSSCFNISTSPSVRASDLPQRSIPCSLITWITPCQLSVRVGSSESSKSWLITSVNIIHVYSWHGYTGYLLPDSNRYSSIHILSFDSRRSTIQISEPTLFDCHMHRSTPALLTAEADFPGRLRLNIRYSNPLWQLRYPSHAIICDQEYRENGHTLSQVPSHQSHPAQIHRNPSHI
jgi:hypothetical protein